MTKVSADGWYMFLNEDGTSPSEDRHYPLPPRPGFHGEWTPRLAEADLKEKGYHLISGKNLTWWLNETLYSAEGQGPSLPGNPALFSQVRLIEHVPSCDIKLLRVFAVHCAETVLHLFEAYQPDEVRVRHALEVALRYAHGRSDEAESEAAQADVMEIEKDLEIQQWNHYEVKAYLGCSAAWLAAQAARRCLSTVYVQMRSTQRRRGADHAWGLAKVVERACTAWAKIAMADAENAENELLLYRTAYGRAREDYNNFLIGLINGEIPLPQPPPEAPR